MTKYIPMGSVYIKTHATIMCPCVCIATTFPSSQTSPLIPFLLVRFDFLDFVPCRKTRATRYLLMTDSDCCWLSSPFCFDLWRAAWILLPKNQTNKTQWAKQMPIKMFHVEFWVIERERETKADDSSLWDNAIHMLAFPDEWPKQQHFVFVSTCSNCAGVTIHTNVCYLYTWYTRIPLCAQLITKSAVDKSQRVMLFWPFQF